MTGPTAAQINAEIVRATLTVDADGAAALLGGAFVGRNGPKGDLVRRLYRDGRFPAPIDETLGPRLWSWSRAAIERYAGAPPVRWVTGLDEPLPGHVDDCPPHGLERPSLRGVS